MLPRLFILVLCALLSSLAFLHAQNPNESDAVRVNVTVNPDGSRTSYQFDTANHKATATTTEANGKPGKKIEYQLDDAGRFASGVVFSPDGKFLFKTTYKYDTAGRMQQETQLSKDDTVLSKIVYTYDVNGRQTGYSMYDGAGKLLGHAIAPTPTPPPKPAHKK